MKRNGNGHNCPQSFYLNESSIENVQNYCYLGVEFTSSGSSASTKVNLANHTKKALFKLTSVTKNSNLKPLTSLRLFDHFIKPIIYMDLR